MSSTPIINPSIYHKKVPDTLSSWLYWSTTSLLKTSPSLPLYGCKANEGHFNSAGNRTQNFRTIKDHLHIEFRYPGRHQGPLARDMETNQDAHTVQVCHWQGDVATGSNLATACGYSVCPSGIGC